MKFYYLILLLFLNSQMFGQHGFNHSSYDVTIADLETNYYLNDTLANALVIYERGKSYLDRSNYDLKTEYKKKIKILDQKGFEEANVNIYLYNNESKKESVKKIYATTYNAINGEVTTTKLSKDKIYREKYDENYTIVKFTLPNIKPGSVITYSYTLISPFYFNFKGWQFQSNIPKLYSEYEASIPANLEYHIKLVGLLKLSKQEDKIKKNCITYGTSQGDCIWSKYIMKDIPAFVEEEYMTSKNDYMSRVEYELKTIQNFNGLIKHYTKNWKTADKDMKRDPSIGRQLTKSLNLEDILPKNILEEQDQLLKAQSIYKYIQSNYVWNNTYKIHHGVSIKKLINKKSGNVSEINILLHNVLNESNFNVKPVLLSTRDNGIVTKLFPVLSEFNYLIVQLQLDNKTYLLDATDPYLSFGELPFRCLNGYGRLLDFKEGSRWIDIISETTSTTQHQIKLHFTGYDQIIGNVSSRYTNYHATHVKKFYFSNPDNYLEYLENNHKEINIVDYKDNTSKKNSNKFQEAYDIKINELEVIGDKLYLDPFIVKYISENPFKLQKRSYPIDFGFKSTFLYSFFLDLDNFYVLEDIPKEKKVSLPNNLGDLILSSKLQNNRIHLFFRVSIKNTIFVPELYDYLKEYFSEIVNTQTKSIIVLKKK